MAAIETFKNYRKFLKAKFAEEKQRSKFFSHAYSASRLKVNKVYLKHIIEEKRHSSIEKLPSLMKLFKLTDFECQYFLFLFLHNTAKDRKNLSYFSSVLKGLRSQKQFTANYVTNDQEKIDVSLLFSSLPSDQEGSIATCVSIFDLGEGPWFVALLQKDRGAVLAGERKQRVPSSKDEMKEYVKLHTLLADFGDAYGIGSFFQRESNRFIFSYATPGDTRDNAASIRIAAKSGEIDARSPQFLQLRGSTSTYSGATTAHFEIDERTLECIACCEISYPRLEQARGVAWGKKVRLVGQN